MRPAVHFTPVSGWVNDPHGITARDGGYDVFFQYVPDAQAWAPNCHWGHATGADLLSLQERAVALAPGDGDDGVWGGVVVVGGGENRGGLYAGGPPHLRSVVTPGAPAWRGGGEHWAQGE